MERHHYPDFTGEDTETRGGVLPVEVAQFPSTETPATPVVACPMGACSATPIRKMLILARTLHGIRLQQMVTKRIPRTVGNIYVPEVSEGE